MNADKLKSLLAGLVVGAAAVLGVLGVLGVFNKEDIGAANRVPHGYIDTADGYYVDGSAVINGSGQVVGTIAGTSATLSGSLAVTGALNYTESYEAITASNTIAIAESGKTFLLSGATSTQTLPTSTTAGQIYRF